MFKENVRETVWIILVRNYHLVKSILTFYTLTWKYKWVKIAQIAHYEMVRPLTAFYTDSFHGSFHCIQYAGIHNAAYSVIGTKNISS